MSDALLELAEAFASSTPGADERLLLKVVEEAGEVAQAWIGYLGTNPRKGTTHNLEDVRMELLDVALTSLIAWTNLGGAERSAIDALEQHARWRRARHVAATREAAS